MTLLPNPGKLGFYGVGLPGRVISCQPWRRMIVEIIFHDQSQESMGPGRDRTRDPGSAVRHTSVVRHVNDCATRLKSLIWVQTVCKGYHQTTLVGKELNDDCIKIHKKFWPYGKSIKASFKDPC